MLTPILSRLTATGAGYLVATGADAELSQQLATAVAGVVIIALDLAQSYKARVR